MTNKELMVMVRDTMLTTGQAFKVLSPGLTVTVIVGVTADGLVEHTIGSQEKDVPAVLKRLAMVCEEKPDERPRIITPGKPN